MLGKDIIPLKKGDKIPAFVRPAPGTLARRAKRLKIRYPQSLGPVAEFQEASLQKRRGRSPFIKIDPRLACLLVIILLFSLPFIKGRDLWTLGRGHRRGHRLFICRGVGGL